MKTHRNLRFAPIIPFAALAFLAPASAAPPAKPIAAKAKATAKATVPAVDFTRYSTRAYLAHCPPACGGELAFRGRPLAGSPADTAERARIHEELDRVGLALRT